MIGSFLHPSALVELYVAQRGQTKPSRIALNKAPWEFEKAVSSCR
jgi:hypothetical protein